MIIKPKNAASYTIDHCPKCGSTEGYYTKDRVSGIVHYKNSFDPTEEKDNCEMYDYLSHKTGKVAYCIDCDKKICNTDDIMDDIFE